MGGTEGTRGGREGESDNVRQGRGEGDRRWEGRREGEEGEGAG